MISLCVVIAVWLKAFQFTKLYEGVSGYRQWWILMNESSLGSNCSALNSPAYWIPCNIRTNLYRSLALFPWCGLLLDPCSLEVKPENTRALTQGTGYGVTMSVSEVTEFILVSKLHSVDVIQLHRECQSSTVLM